MIGKEILKYAESKSNIRQAWIGLNPQFNMDIIDMNPVLIFDWHQIYMVNLI